MTDLESPRRNNDCYFYYYSTCAKGDNCTFRHEPSALGSETMCAFWKEGKCLNVHCNFRHMELRKNRKAIPCYWETQPGGCLKPHCPFMHQNARFTPAPNDSLENRADSGTESADNTMNEKMNHMSDKNPFKNNPVDSLVVNFEEESDNESLSFNSPIKMNQRPVKVKTLEEIKLERIQAESAAYYSYQNIPLATPQYEDDSDDLRKRILERMSSKTVKSRLAPAFTRKRSIDATLTQVPDSKFKRQKRDIPQTDVKEIKIKTLAEIRAEKAKKTQELLSDAVVSSTCSEEMSTRSESPVRAKVKLQRDRVEAEDKQVEMETEPPKPEEEPPLKVEKSLPPKETSKYVLSEDEDEEMAEHTNRAMDEVLLLQDDDETFNVSMKEEDELLNDIDELLED